MLVVVVVAVVLVAVVVGGPSRDGIMMDPAIRSGQGGDILIAMRIYEARSPSSGRLNRLA